MPIIGKVKYESLWRGGASAAIKMGQVALSLALAIALARALGPEEYGIYSYCFAITSLLAIPAQLGLPLLVVRETASASALSDWGRIRGLWRVTTCSVMAFSTILLGCAFAFISIFRERFSNNEIHTLMMGLVLVPAFSLGTLRGAALRGLQKVIQGQLPDQIIRPSLFIIGIIIATCAFHVRVLSALDAMTLHVIAAVAAFAVGTIMLSMAHGGRAKVDPTYEFRDWIISAVPLAATAGLQALNSQADILMIGAFMTSRDVGVYRIAVQGGAIALFLFQSLNIVIMPQIARLYALREIAEIRHIINYNAKLLAIFSIVVFVCVSIFGGTAISMAFGEKFSGAAAPLTILCLGLALGSYFGFGGSLLVMTGYEAKATICALIAAVLNVLGNVLLVPIFGINGAAISTAGSYLIWRILLYRLAIRYVGISSRASFSD